MSRRLVCVRKSHLSAVPVAFARRRRNRFLLVGEKNSLPTKYYFLMSHWPTVINSRKVYLYLPGPATLGLHALLHCVPKLHIEKKMDPGKMSTMRGKIPSENTKARKVAF